MSQSILYRIAVLEASLPEEIILTLDDGNFYHHPGPALRFYSEGLEQIRENRGPLLEAVRRTVNATGCGLIWQLLDALTEEDSLNLRRTSS
jgi:hypothetical protein